MLLRTYLCRQVEGGRRKRKGETWNAADLGFAQDLRVLARLFVFAYARRTFAAQQNTPEH